MKKACVCGSFDPMTKGHEYIIKKAAELFPDGVVVVIGHNPQKKGYFSVEDRKNFIQSFINAESLTNVSTIDLSEEYIASWAKREGVEYMVKGLRDSKDLEYERAIAQVNEKINPKLQNVFLFPPADLNHVSSSLVKSLVGFIGWHEQVNLYVRPEVYSGFMEKIHETTLRKAWDSVLVDRASVNFEEEFKKVLRGHSESHRYYHNTTHLYNLLAQLDRLPLSIQDKSILTAAIFFHDLVYVPMSKDSEVQSAQKWMEMASKGKTPVDYAKKVEEIILATRSHQKTGDALVDIFLDLDLAILGTESKVFEEYERNIRLEYIKVPEEIYNVERAKVMVKFKSPYYTAMGEAFYGEQRQSNLKKY